MFHYLTKGLWAGIAIARLNKCRRLSLQLLKIEAAKCYVHGVRQARLSVIGLLWLGVVIGLIGAGVLLFHAGLFILLPWTVETKAVLGMCLGTAYVIVGCVALRAAMNEKTWLAKSGVAEMLENVAGLSSKG